MKSFKAKDCFAVINFEYTGDIFDKQKHKVEITFPKVKSLKDVKNFDYFFNKFLEEIEYSVMILKERKDFSIRLKTDPFSAPIVEFRFPNAEKYKSESGIYDMNMLLNDFKENLNISAKEVYLRVI